MADQSYGTPSSLLIREITGLQRVLELQGRAMPYRGFRVGGKMRAEFTAYPGSPVRSLQILGPEEDETPIHGEWKDRFIMPAAQGVGAAKWDDGTGAGVVQVANVKDLVKAMDSIRRGGQLVRVTWSGIARVGILAHFVATFENEHDAAWEGSFEWSSQDEALAPLIITATPNSTGAISGAQGQMSKFATALNNVSATIAAVQDKVEIAEGVVGGVLTKLNTINDAVFGMTDIANTVTVGGASVSDSARAMIGGFNNISALASDLMSTMRAFAPADLFTLNQALPTAPGWPAPSVGTQLAAVAFQRSVIGIARDLRAQAAKASSDLEAQVGVSAPVIATIIGKQSSDLRKLSMQYYGTQDNWQKIASFNGLSGGLIPPGKLLMVPRL